MAADTTSTTQTTASPAAATATTAEPQYHWQSVRYNSYPTWKKVFFWISVLAWANLGYWLVRLIVYLVNKDRSKSERLDKYATQAYVFGWINVIGIIIAIMYSVILALMIAASVAG